MDYKEAGVDIAEGYRAVERYRELSARTANAAVLNGIGGFAGLYALGEAAAGMEEPVLVSGADGVGTKLDLAFKMRKYDTLGIDCVAMCVNDVLCHGARPLFFLDYLACGKLDADVAAQIVQGVARGCRETGTALLGGETAEMPGFYDAGKYDIAGFCVGIVDRKRIVDGSAVREGDALVGLASSGPHSNGFSLIRAALPDLWEDFGGMPLGMALLEPTRLYVKPLLSLMEHIDIHGMAHITGGGFYENIPRLFAPSAMARDGALDAVVREGAWAIPPLFARIAAATARASGGGKAEALGAELLKTDAETKKRMFSTFNMGIGFVLAVAPHDVRRALEHLDAAGFPAWEIGLIERARAQTAPGAAAEPKGTLRFV